METVLQSRPELLLLPRRHARMPHRRHAGGRRLHAVQFQLLCRRISARSRCAAWQICLRLDLSVWSGTGIIL